MGNLSETQNGYEEAEDNYKKAIVLDPKHIGSYQNLALLH